MPLATSLARFQRPGRTESFKAVGKSVFNSRGQPLALVWFLGAKSEGGSFHLVGKGGPTNLRRPNLAGPTWPTRPGPRPGPGRWPEAPEGLPGHSLVNEQVCHRVVKTPNSLVIVFFLAFRHSAISRRDQVRMAGEFGFLCGPLCLRQLLYGIMITIQIILQSVVAHVIIISECVSER